MMNLAESLTRHPLQSPPAHRVPDAQPDPEPATPSLPEPDPAVYRPDPGSQPEKRALA